MISTATTAPKVRALVANPNVALAIDAGNTAGGARSLSVRGRADVEIVDGVVPEYLLAPRRTMDAERVVDFEQNIRRMYLQMARIAVTPGIDRGPDMRFHAEHHLARVWSALT